MKTGKSCEGIVAVKGLERKREAGLKVRDSWEGKSEGG